MFASRLLPFDNFFTAIYQHFFIRRPLKYPQRCEILPLLAVCCNSLNIFWVNFSWTFLSIRMLSAVGSAPRGHSLTVLTSFWTFLTTYLTHVDICGRLSLLLHIRENLHYIPLKFLEPPTYLDLST